MKRRFSRNMASRPPQYQTGWPWSATLRASGTQLRDLLISKGPLDRLDHSSNFESFGYKMGIDATRPIANEGHDREWPEALEMDEGVKARVDAMWNELGL